MVTRHGPEHPAFGGAAVPPEETPIAHEHSLNPRQALAVGLLLEQPELRVEDMESLTPA